MGKDGEIWFLIIDGREKARQQIFNLLDNNVDSLAMTASSGSEGVQSMKDHGADVVIIDRKLPDGNGMNYAKSLKKQYPDTKFLIIGKKFSASERKYIIETRGITYLTRPYSFQRFASKISFLLEGRTNAEGLMRGLRERKQRMAQASKSEMRNVY